MSDIPMTGEQFRQELYKGRTDFYRTNLTGANLTGSNLTGAYLIGVDLRGADLRGADLYRANLAGANLLEANLIEAYLSGADLRGADLRGANLNRATLIRANLISANLYGANLAGANLTGVDLRGADLSFAVLTGANLTGVDLRGADLRGADLRGADLTGADLRGADLSFAVLTGANLTGSNLRRANLIGANLIGVNFNNANIKGVQIDEKENPDFDITIDLVVDGYYRDGDGHFEKVQGGAGERNEVMLRRCFSTFSSMISFKSTERLLLKRLREIQTYPNTAKAKHFYKNAPWREIDCIMLTGDLFKVYVSYGCGIDAQGHLVRLHGPDDLLPELVLPDGLWTGVANKITHRCVFVTNTGDDETFEFSISIVSKPVVDMPLEIQEALRRESHKTNHGDAEIINDINIRSLYQEVSWSEKDTEYMSVLPKAIAVAPGWKLLLGIVCILGSVALGVVTGGFGLIAPAVGYAVTGVLGALGAGFCVSAGVDAHREGAFSQGNAGILAKVNTADPAAAVGSVPGYESTDKHVAAAENKHAPGGPSQ